MHGRPMGSNHVPGDSHVLLQGSVIVGILFVTFISWIPGHAASWLGTKSQLLGGLFFPCMNAQACVLITASSISACAAVCSDQLDCCCCLASNDSGLVMSRLC